MEVLITACNLQEISISIEHEQMQTKIANKKLFVLIFLFEVFVQNAFLK